MGSRKKRSKSSSGARPPDGKESATAVPTREEIALLPRWARVAFAARCARRVQPLYTHLWRQAPKKHVIALDRAIKLAEDAAAARAAYAPDAADASDAARAAADAADAHAAAYAAAAAFAAVADDASDAVRAAADASDAARAAAEAYGAASYSIVTRAMRSDINRLMELATRERWTDSTPVPPSIFGPMWLGGAPTWWRKPVQGKRRVHILAKELNVSSKAIVEKCRTEGIDSVENHMSSLSSGLEATIREWFSEDESQTAEMAATHPSDHPTSSADDTSTVSEAEYREPPALKFWIDPGNASRETIQGVLRALSDLHEAHGGLGLEYRFVKDRILVLEGVPA